VPLSTCEARINQRSQRGLTKRCWSPCSSSCFCCIPGSPLSRLRGSLAVRRCPRLACALKRLATLLALTYCARWTPISDTFEPVGDEPARAWLRSDVSIECYTAEHDSVRMLSWLAIIVYPIGLWVFCLVLLCTASHDIISDQPTHFSRSISFLYNEYQVTTFWWELMEMLRKFLLVGLLVIVKPGTILQIASGTIASAAYLVRPLHNCSDSLTSLLAHVGSFDPCTDDTNSSCPLQERHGYAARIPQTLAFPVASDRPAVEYVHRR
jgi:hypothetical protein